MDIAAGVGKTTTSHGLSQQQVDAAAAQAALQRARNVEAEAQKAYDQLAAARAQIDQALAKAGYEGAATYQIDERGLVVHVVADNVLFDSAQATLRPERREAARRGRPDVKGCPTRCGSRATPTSSRSTPAAPGPRTGSCRPTAPPRCCGT